MENYKNSVPFDPGYNELQSELPADILEHIELLKKSTPKHKIKFELSRLLPHICKSIDAIAAIYLGCVVWGAFLKYYFDTPVKIEGNPAEKLSEEEKQSFDYTEELVFVEKLIKELDRDSKYYLGKPLQINKNVKKALESYYNFVKINENFLSTFYTNEIKETEYMKKYSAKTKEELENLHNLIKTAIKEQKIYDILEIE